MEELGESIAVDEIDAHRRAEVFGEQRLMFEKSERPRREEDALGDVAEARVAEVDVALVVARVGDEAHSPLARHLAKLEDSDRQRELCVERAKREAVGLKAAVLGARGVAEPV